MAGSFAQTCNRLSQFLKNGGSFGDISLFEAAAKSTTTTTTMNLFPTAVESSSSAHKAIGNYASKSVDVVLPPKFAAFGSASFKEEPTNSSSASKKPTDPEIAQMTIFYAGQVIVLDGFPSDKAVEIMGAAKSASSTRFTAFLGGGGASSAVDQMIISGASDCNQVQEAQLQLQPEAAAATARSSDLPIARRSSLRRFLEKRKDRIATRAPYQMNNKPVGLSRPEESHSWIDLEAAPSKHLELRL